MSRRRPPLVLAVLVAFAANATVPAFAKDKPDPKWQQLKGNIAGDLTQAGLTFAAGLTGSVPLALTAGILGKYISTYGIQGIKNLVDSIKGYPPQDMGELNLAYMYLIHVKRNLYSTLISMRKAAETDPRETGLITELDLLEKEVTSLCAEKDKCQPAALDESLVNYSFLQVALDAKSSININDWLSLGEVRNTYQDLVLLYLDVVMTEQLLIQTQANVIGQQVKESVESLKKNAYISEAEKEFQAQLILNVALRWQKMLDERRVMIAKVIQAPAESLEEENRRLEEELKKEQKKNPPPVEETD
jgi:hypothetical protein